jgi:polyhydroxybutyrate depolymerase
MTSLRKILPAILGVVVGLPLLVGVVAVFWINRLDRTTGTILAANTKREYLLHVPASYDSLSPTPLVISLHAGATWPAHQQNLSHWNRLADAHGFIVAYPSGTPQFLGVARIWRTWPDGVLTDVAFIAALMDTLEATYNIDRTRIYVDGMSNGGGMVFALSCTLSDRIAAVGMVAAAQQLPPSWCTAGRPMPMIAFHGDADPLVRYNGGRLGDPFNPVRPVYPAVRDFVAEWAKRNRCTAPPIASKVADDVARLAYLNCTDGAAVVLYTLLGGGHSWPGGKAPPRWRVGRTNTSMDATAALWEFFLDHPRQPR